MTRPVAGLLTAAACAWVLAVFYVALAPATVLAAGLELAGALVCHQRPERSFDLHGIPLAVCARCTGLYVGGAAGTLAGWAGSPRWPPSGRVLLLGAMIPILLTVLLEAAHLLAFGNSARAACAAPLGAVAGWSFIRLLREERPGTCAIIS